jgi:hypothetical protein
MSNPAITKVPNGVFSNSDVDMDNKRFFNGKFINCTLMYAGGQCEWDEYTTFKRCTWKFSGAADRTIQVLQAVRPEGGEFTWSGKYFSIH